MSPKYFLSIHPRTHYDLVDAIIRDGRPPYYRSDVFSDPHRIFGFELRGDSHVKPAEIVEKWIPPRDPFVTYEDSDRAFVWEYCRRGSLEYRPVVPVEIRPIDPVAPIKATDFPRERYRFVERVSIIRPEFNYEIDEWIDRASRAAEYIQKTVAERMIDVACKAIENAGGSPVRCGDSLGDYISLHRPVDWRTRRA